MTHAARAQQLMSDPLFEVGNHTWGHHNLRLLRGRPLVDEIRNGRLAYSGARRNLEKMQCVRTDRTKFAHEIAPQTLKLFRFPYGACDMQSLNAVADLGMLSIQWDVSSGDPWIGQTAEMIKQDVMRRVRPGSIVLFHANGRGWHTESALPKIIEALRKEKYRFVTVSELLAAGEWEITAECFDNKRRDTDIYDDIAARMLKEYERFKEAEAFRSIKLTIPASSKTTSAVPDFSSEQQLASDEENGATPNLSCDVPPAGSEWDYNGRWWKWCRSRAPD